MKNITFAVIVAAAASVAALTVASAKQRPAANDLPYATVSVPLMLGVGY